MEAAEGKRSTGLRERLAALADHPAVLRILFLCAFIEASLFPMPPDFVLVPLVLARPRRALAAATVCIAGSFAGAIAGYVIGATVITGAGDRLIAWAGVGPSFDRVLALYAGNAFTALCAAGFTAIPFSVFTIAAGFRHTVAPLTFLLGALLGRVIRFSLLAAALRAGGPPVRRMVSEHPAAVSLAVMLIAAVIVVLYRIL